MDSTDKIFAAMNLLCDQACRYACLRSCRDRDANIKQTLVKPSREYGGYAYYYPVHPVEQEVTDELRRRGFLKTTSLQPDVEGWFNETVTPVGWDWFHSERGRRYHESHVHAAE